VHVGQPADAARIAPCREPARDLRREKFLHPFRRLWRLRKQRGRASFVLLLKPVAASAACPVHQPPLHWAVSSKLGRRKWLYTR